MFYDKRWRRGCAGWFDTLVDRGAIVLVGDPGRTYLPQSELIALAELRGAGDARAGGCRGETDDSLAMEREERLMTYSIIGRDLDKGEIGCAVQSKFPGVGSLVLHGRGGVGAVTTQGFADPRAAAKMLDLMEHGASADEAAAIAVRDLDGVAERQFGVLAMHGAGVGHTGAAMDDWNGFSGCMSGDGCIACGNALVGENVVAAMIRTFEAMADSPLADRLIAALRAGRDAGGELRGEQAAGLLVLKEEGGYGGLSRPHGRHHRL